MKKKVWIILSISGVLLAISVISFGITFYIIQRNTWCLGITDVSYLPVANVNGDWELNAITDYYPDTSWRLLKPKISFYEDDLLVTIGICGRHSRDVGLMMTVQLEATITLVFPNIGNWTVRCNNQTIYVQVI